MHKLKIKNNISSTFLKNGNFHFKAIKKSITTLKELVEIVLNKEIDNNSSNLVIDFNLYNFFTLDQRTSFNQFVHNSDLDYKDFINSLGLKLFYLNCNINIAIDGIGLKTKKIPPKALILTPFDFFKLADSFLNKYINNSVLLFLCDCNKNIVTYNIPFSETYGKFLTSQDLANDYYLPLTEKEPKMNDLIGDWRSRELLSKELLLKKKTNSLFPFPLFNREITIEDRIDIIKDEKPCINCKKCLGYCSANLYPNFYYHYIKNHMFQEANSINISKCIQCGICQFICPSNIPISETIAEFVNLGSKNGC